MELFEYILKCVYAYKLVETALTDAKWRTIIHS